MKDFFLKIIKIFNPIYIYTIDRSHHRSDEGYWLFKEYGTHTFVKKKLSQILDGDFIYCVNPKDIAYIVSFEEKIKMEKDSLRVKEEGRNGKLVLSNYHEEVKVTCDDFLVNQDLVERTNSSDVSRIAYIEGFKKGRQLSDIMKTPSSENKKPRLTLIK